MPTIDELDQNTVDSLDLNDPDASLAALERLRQRRNQQIMMQNQETGGVGNFLSDFSVGLGTAIAGGNSVQAIEQQQAGRRSEREQRLKALQNQQIQENSLTLGLSRLMEQRRAKEESERFQKELLNMKISGADKRAGQKGTKGEEALDRSFAKDYNDYVAGGGYASIQKNLGNLRSIIEDMRSGKITTGGASSILPDTARAYLDPEGVNAQQQSEAAVQATLRPILGSQFTEREASQVFKRAWNPKLPTEKNIAGMEKLYTELQKQAEAKEAASQYFEDHGTLAGFRGTTRKFENGPPGPAAPRQNVAPARQETEEEEFLRLSEKFKGRR